MTEILLAGPQSINQSINQPINQSINQSILLLLRACSERVCDCCLTPNDQLASYIIERQCYIQ
jgi:hypothetical protein